MRITHSVQAEGLKDGLLVHAEASRGEGESPNRSPHPPTKKESRIRRLSYPHYIEIPMLCGTYPQVAYFPKYLFSRPSKAAPCLASSLHIS